jgi:chromate reductase
MGDPVVLAWMPAASVYFRDPDDGILTWRERTLAADPLEGAGTVRGAFGVAATRRVESVMCNTDVVRVLAISGSLRRASSNSALVDAAVRLAPVGVEVSIYRELADIPPFNPDLDTDVAPATVFSFRAALDTCDAILISSPEYAHGVSGVLKNALDWVVGSGELIDKPIALINASTRATHAHASLRETLTTMSGRVIEDASITVPLEGTAYDADGIARDVRLSELLRSSLAALARSTRPDRAP